MTGTLELIKQEGGQGECWGQGDSQVLVRECRTFQMRIGQYKIVQNLGIHTGEEDVNIVKSHLSMVTLGERTTNLLLAVTGLHDLIDEKKLAGYDGGAHKHLTLDHVKVENAHFVRAEKQKEYKLKIS
jgi:hypothetical protein